MAAKVGILIDSDGVSSVAIVGSSVPEDRAQAFAILAAVREEIDALHEAVCARLAKVTDTPERRRRVDEETRRLREWCARHGIPFEG